MSVLEHLDAVLLEPLNRSAANPLFDAAFPVLTSLHQRPWFVAALGLICMAALLRGGRRTRVWVLTALVAVGISDAACSRVVKPIFPRERPCQKAARLQQPVVRVVRPEGCPGSSSFPSNHAANMMAAATVCWWFSRRRGRWLWFLLPLVIGYTRVYLGYHYPSDVLGGSLLGGGVAAMTLLAARRALRPSGRDGGSADTAPSTAPPDP